MNDRGMSSKPSVTPTGIARAHLSVRVQRVEHRGRRQEVPAAQILSAALLEPQLLRLREDPLAALPAGLGLGLGVVLPPQRGAQRPDGRRDPERRSLVGVLHHRHNASG